MPAMAVQCRHNIGERVKREEQMGWGWYKKILIELDREEMFLLIII